MKLKHYFFSLLALLASINAFAYDAKIDGIYYNFSGDEATVTYCSNDNYFNSSAYSGDIVIPESVTYNGKPYSVTSIGDIAFHQCSGLTSITIPGSVTSIGNEAFVDCSGLTSITIPESVTSIGEDAFSGTAWYDNQPDGLAYAGKVAYKYKGTMPSDTRITLEEGTVGIADYAFSGCYGLTSIIIPNSVTSIGEWAFMNCSGLTSITIPGSVKIIGYSAFGGCGRLTAVHITDLAAWCNTSFGNQPLYYAHHLYLNGEEIKDLVIPNSVTSIGNGAFQGCSGLTSVSIPNSVTSIGQGAFFECSGLTSVFIPNSVTNIGQSAFGFCTGLTSVTIGNSVTSIGDYAFNSCNSLTDIYCYAESVPTAGTNAFTNYTAKLHVPTGSVQAYQTTEPWSKFGSNIEGYFISFADDNVKAICVAKWDTDGDGELNINEAAAVTNLSTYFKSNMQITSFDELKYFTGLTSIGSEAFYLCRSMASTIIPENVTSIGQTAFWGCNSLTSVNIPSKVTTIGKDAFSGCTGLTAVNITDLSAWCNISFVSSSSQPLGNAHKLYLNGQEITKLNTPSDVIKINNYAFRGCTGLTSVVLSSSVLSIGERCFYDCSGLTDVYIPSSMTSVGSYAFYKCTALTDVYCYTEEVPNTNTYAFTSSNYKAAALHVLDVAEEAFRTTLPWKDFGTIEVIRPYISFADQTVKDICIANWDINGDGEMTLEEAAAVTDLGDVFMENTEITSFNELQYFTGLTYIGIMGNGGGRPQAFSGCSSLTSIIIPNSVSGIGNCVFLDCTSLTSVNIPEGVTHIGNRAFSGCSGLTSITIPNNVVHVGSQAFSDCKLRNVLVKSVTPPVDKWTDPKRFNYFSEQTLYHATLYIPVGSWDAYAFDDYWYLFHNIRETALMEEQVSEQQAYTLMDAGTFAYSVYDPVNDCIGTINSAGNIDENNPNHSWQMIEADGMHYLYNIGAKKFVKRNGIHLELTDVPEPIDVENGEIGLILGAQTAQQWALVGNEHMNVAQSAIDEVTGINYLNAADNNSPIYNLAGQRLSKMRKGINIKDGKKIIIK